jgi:hypothetical protein
MGCIRVETFGYGVMFLSAKSSLESKPFYLSFSYSSRPRGHRYQLGTVLERELELNGTQKKINGSVAFASLYHVPINLFIAILW